MTGRVPLRLPIRLRVAGAFALTTVVALVALGSFVHVRVEAALMARSRESLVTQLDALARVPPARRPEFASGMHGRHFAEVLTVDGTQRTTSSQVKGSVLKAGDLPRPGEEAVWIHRNVRLVSEDEREESLLLVRQAGEQLLVIGTPNEDVEETLDGVRDQFLVGGPIALLIASGAGYLVAGLALKPIERMRRQASAISSKRSDDRLPLPVARDEIHRLGETLNAMLERLSSGLRRERRFVAEASHELRTPLALLRMELDLALSTGRSSDELRAALGSASEEVDRLTRLAEDLLLLAASDAAFDAASATGRLDPRRVDVDLGVLLERVAARFRARAAAEGRAITVTGDVPVVVRAHHDHLDRAVSNLVDNALRHGAGTVEIGADAHDGTVSVRVTDDGVGVPAQVRERAFERFGRAPGARKTQGSGLGLAIVRAVVEEHDGSASMGETPEGRTVVTLELPASRPWSAVKPLPRRPDRDGRGVPTLD